MTALAALAERIEQAEGPSETLFEEAFAACFPKPADDCEPAWRPELPRQPIFHAWKTRQIAFLHFVNAGAWLDAAMTLVPEGWSVGMGDLRGYNPLLWRAHLRDHNPESLTAEGHSHIWKEGHSKHGLALALCAAALRARAAV